MFHLSYKLFGDEAYEITDRYTPPYTSSAQRYYDDSVSIRQLIMQFPPAPDDWVRILMRICERPLHFYSNHPGEVYDAVTTAVATGELCIYKLPNLSEVFSLRGKDNTGLFFMRGPNPHCATHLKPEIIKSVQSAQQLLNESGISQALLLHELGLKSVYNSYQQHEPFEEVCRLLARGDILVYKIPLSPKAAPSTSVGPDEIVSTRPVSLGPHDEPGYVAPSPVRPLNSNPLAQPPAQSFEDCEQRLAAARERLIKNGYQSKYTDEELMVIAQKGELDDRFVVRLIKSTRATPEDYLGFKAADGSVKYWSTTFNQLENADSDPQTLCAVIGVPYDPKCDYTLAIVDTQTAVAGQSVTIVPTYANFGAFAASEIKRIDEVSINRVMTSEYSEQYLRDKAAFLNDGGDIKEDKDIVGYAIENFSIETEQEAFKTRALIDRKLGANEFFTGDGTTKNLLPNSTERGVMETFTYDKNPATLSNMQAKGGLKLIATIPLVEST